MPKNPFPYTVHLFFRRGKNYFSIEELFSEISAQLNQYGVKTRDIISPYLSFGLVNRIVLIFHALKNKGDINHITGDINFLGIVLPRKNTILTIHDCGELENLKGIKRFFLWFFWYFWPIKRLKYITTVSEATKQHLLSYVHVNPDKIRVIHNCMIGRYKVKYQPFNTVQPRILQIGTTRNKNFTRVVEALSGIDSTLVILGKIPESDVNLLRAANIIFENKYDLTREEVQDLYAGCDLLLYPSLIEGFGLPIIEAQATGIPVITSNLSSMPEVAGDAACFVNPYDIMEIKNAVLKIIKDTIYREELIQKGFENVKRFSKEVITMKYINYYEEVLRK